MQSLSEIEDKVESLHSKSAKEAVAKENKLNTKINTKTWIIVRKQTHIRRKSTTNKLFNYFQTVKFRIILNLSHYTKCSLKTLYISMKTGGI